MEGANFFKFIIKNDQSKMSKSHMFDTSLKLIDQKCLMAKYCSFHK